MYVGTSSGPSMCVPSKELSGGAHRPQLATTLLHLLHLDSFCARTRQSGPRAAFSSADLLQSKRSPALDLSRPMLCLPSTPPA